MLFRIGVHLGDIMAEGDRVYGDGINIAARLEGLAEPGGVCISSSVRDQIHNRLDIGLEDVGDQEVKNISEPERVYRVRTTAPIEERSQVARVTPSRLVAAGVVLGGPQRLSRQCCVISPQRQSSPCAGATRTEGGKVCCVLHSTCASLRVSCDAPSREGEYFSSPQLSAIEIGCSIAWSYPATSLTYGLRPSTATATTPASTRCCGSGTWKTHRSPASSRARHDSKVLPLWNWAGIPDAETSRGDTVIE